VGLERGPLCLVGTTEELLEKKSNGSGLENREHAEGFHHADHHPLSAKVAPTSPTSGNRSVGIVRSRSQATEFSFFRG
jgi:hypothetical protein